MKTHFALLSVCVLLAGAFATPVDAGQGGRVIDSTVPLSDGLRHTLDDWLAADPPGGLRFFAVTYISDSSEAVAVSLAGLAIESPDDHWSLSTGQIAWLGTVRVDAGGRVSLPVGIGKSPGLAIPAAQGEAYILFPWQAGKAMLYGSRGVHGEGDYGTSNMYAIDLHGGPDLGSNVAGPYVFASSNGTIDYVCDDGVTVAVRTTNAVTGQKFLYAHLIDNENLEIDETFNQGQLIGTLKSGSFDDSCGYAEQGAGRYHLHWMLEPYAGGFLHAEGCILKISDGDWLCGNEKISPGQYLYHYGVTLGDDPGGAGDVTFFDMFLIGVLSLFERAFANLLPEHTSPTELLQTLSNGIILTFRVAFVLLKGNFNIGPAIGLFAFALAWKAGFTAVWLAVVVLRAIKSIGIGIP